jgi:hypothetical protein
MTLLVLLKVVSDVQIWDAPMSARRGIAGLCGLPQTQRIPRLPSFLNSHIEILDETNILLVRQPTLVQAENLIESQPCRFSNMAATPPIALKQ